MAGVLEMGREEFAALVDDALAGIPTELARAVRNVAILIEDESPPGGPTLLGLYEGIPLTQRSQWYAGVLPDRITIFRLSILRHVHSREQAVAEIRKTVVHEIGHYFGIGDKRLRELGY